MSIENRHDVSERQYLLREERSFHSRARADRLVALWAAARMGLGENEALVYADEVVRAGVIAPGGRGGFDRIAADLAAVTSVHIEAIRTQYAIAMAAPAMAAASLAADLRASS